MDYNKAAEFGLQQLITRRLTTPGGLPAPTVAPEMFPCLTLENDRPEWAVLKGERLAAAQGAVTAVAGQNSLVAISNPAGSGIIATLEQFGINVGVSGIRLMVTAQLFATTPVIATVRDTRWIQPGTTAARPVCGVQNGAQAAVAPAEAPIARLGFSQQTVYTSPIVWGPGHVLLAYAETVNIAIFNWWASWRERSAQPGELG